MRFFDFFKKKSNEIIKDTNFKEDQLNKLGLEIGQQLFCTNGDIVIFRGIQDETLIIEYNKKNYKHRLDELGRTFFINNTMPINNFQILSSHPQKRFTYDEIDDRKSIESEKTPRELLEEIERIIASSNSTYLKKSFDYGKVYIQKNTESDKNSWVLEKIGISKSIPVDTWSRELALHIVTYKADLIRFIPRDILDEEICKIALINNIETSKYIPVDIWNKEMALHMATYNAEFIQIVPDHVLDGEICKIALINNIEASKCIPVDIWDKEMALYIATHKAEFIRFVPKCVLDGEIYKIALINDIEVFGYVPVELIDCEIALRAVKSKIELCLTLKPEQWNYDIAKYVSQYGWRYIENIPKELIDGGICIEALKSDMPLNVIFKLGYMDENLARFICGNFFGKYKLINHVTDNLLYIIFLISIIDNDKTILDYVLNNEENLKEYETLLKYADIICEIDELTLEKKLVINIHIQKPRTNDELHNILNEINSAKLLRSFMELSKLDPNEILFFKRIERISNRSIIYIDFHGLSAHTAEVLTRRLIQKLPQQVSELIIIHGYHHGKAIKNMIARFDSDLKTNRVSRVSYNEGRSRISLK